MDFDERTCEAIAAIVADEIDRHRRDYYGESWVPDFVAAVGAGGRYVLKAWIDWLSVERLRDRDCALGGRLLRDEGLNLVEEAIIEGVVDSMTEEEVEVWERLTTPQPPLMATNVRMGGVVHTVSQNGTSVSTRWSVKP